MPPRQLAGDLARPAAEIGRGAGSGERR